MGNLLRRKIEDIESKRIFLEQEGSKSFSQLLLDLIEKLNKKKEKLEDSEINVIL